MAQGEGFIRQVWAKFHWPSSLADRSIQFHNHIVIPSCGLIWKEIGALGIINPQFLAELEQPRGLDFPPVIGPLWDLPIARLLRIYDCNRDEMIGRIDVLVRSRLEVTQ